MTVKPGWYADPAEPTTQRYWDGEGWIGAPLPVDATPPPGPPPEEPEPATAPADADDPASRADPRSPAVTAPTSGAAAPGAAPGGGDRTGWPGGGLPPSPGNGQPGYGGSPPPGHGQGVPPGSGYPPADGSPDYPPPDYPPPGAPGYPPANGAPGSAAAPPGWVYRPYGFTEPPPRPHGLPLAPFGPRLAARLIDIGILFLLNVVVNGFFVWRLVQDTRPLYDEILRRWSSGDSSTGGLPQTGQADSLQVVILLIAAALWFAYEVPALANGGQTFGKRLMGVKVVPLAADEPLGFGRSLRRWNLLGLPTFLWGCCGIGLLLQLVDCAYPLFDRPLRQALHDKRGQTVVVQVPRPTAGAATRTDSDDRTDTPTSGGPTP